MQTIHLNETFREPTPCVATIGMFDGVHRGHRFVIDCLRQEAARLGLPSCVITFDRHPRQVLQADYCPRLLTTFEERIELLSKTGIDRCVILPFSPEMAALSAKDFMKDILQERIGVKRLYIGYDHRFGHNRSEGFGDYVRYGEEMGMEVLQNDAFVLPPSTHEEAEQQSVSSSSIRKALQQGNVDQASKLLGYPYFLTGKVVNGEHEGRKMGFPTANIDVTCKEKLLPAPGAYVVEVRMEDEERALPGMMNIGTRPTFGENSLSLEVHVLDYSGNLYGKMLTVAFLQRLREEHRFVSTEELREQLMSDAQQVRTYFQQK
jgi:riboflavin kinase/FMN adenylyltransferase